MSKKGNPLRFPTLALLGSIALGYAGVHALLGLWSGAGDDFFNWKGPAAKRVDVGSARVDLPINYCRDDSFLAHDLGMAPLMLAGDLSVVLRWFWTVNRANLRGDVRLATYDITEPGAGSDMEESEEAARTHYMTATRRVPGGYLLNGQEIFISSGAHCDYVTAFAVLEREDGRPARVDRDFTCFIVSRGTEGFRIGRQQRKVGQRAADATQLFFDGVFLPPEHQIYEGTNQINFLAFVEAFWESNIATPAARERSSAQTVTGLPAQGVA